MTKKSHPWFLLSFVLPDCSVVPICDLVEYSMIPPLELWTINSPCKDKCLSDHYLTIPYWNKSREHFRYCAFDFLCVLGIPFPIYLVLSLFALHKNFDGSGVICLFDGNWHIILFLFVDSLYLFCNYSKPWYQEMTLLFIDRQGNVKSHDKRLVTVFSQHVLLWILKYCQEKWANIHFC